MIDRRIVKFKLRRGTNEQRKTVVFEEGELIYTTDTKKVYVGDGRLSGGNLINNAVYNLSGMPASPTANDLVYRGDQKLLYIANSDPYEPFTFVGPYGDDSTITFASNRLTLALSGITPTHLNYTVASNISGVGLNSNGLYINYDPVRLQVVDGRLTVLPNALSGIVVSPGGAIVDTINGIGVVVDNQTLEISTQINGNDLHVKQVSAQHIAPGSINVTKLSADVVAPLSGVVLSSNGLAINYDAVTLKLDNGKLAVNNSIYTNQTGVSGYQLLQNGFMIQWGVLSAVSFNETFSTVTFPTSFTQCYNVQATVSMNSAVVGSIVPIVKNITPTTVSIGTDLGFNTAPTNGNIYWMAIGYTI
jgi:Major tropism determinant N-terminal domain